MKKSLVFLAVLVLVFSVFSVTANVNLKQGIDVEITTEDFPPEVWMCDDRVVLDDNVEPGRLHCDAEGCDELLVERVENYAFEGEQIHWTVLVMDKNGFEKISDVFMTLESCEGSSSCKTVEAECKLDSILQKGESIDDACNARIDEENLDVVPSDNMMAYYECTFTVETPDSMQGPYWVNVEAEDLDGLIGVMDEKEYWFFNPDIALTLDGDLIFDDVRPGSQAYSSSVLVGNGAEIGSGVLLDMFVSGTDFYDSSSSGALCPDTNQLLLDNFAYYATNGAYGSQGDPRGDNDGIASNDGEEYVGICYGDIFQTSMYDKCEIIQSAVNAEGYYAGNILSPGAEISMTFRLALPEPCNGDFDSGQIFFWGEAI